MYQGTVKNFVSRAVQANHVSHEYIRLCKGENKSAGKIIARTVMVQEGREFGVGRSRD